MKLIKLIALTLTLGGMFHMAQVLIAGKDVERNQRPKVDPMIVLVGGVGAVGYFWAEKK